MNDCLRLCTVSFVSYSAALQETAAAEPMFTEMGLFFNVRTGKPFRIRTL